ncbi:MAG: PQQ-dependent sugar dehydrogenase [Nitrospira sp. SB0675_bin_23]|nr:PQQ-dependent sugar dehydrogenase [Nitrospira sp. SB0667_bin_9]MYD30111.1 PQQ-dependent sugar dehydrogenase [Nitrospira sp. SB0661_bin_20]MYH02688.1 PQQ-dependent sugar dehydrogenase [Nitrospira sp. SB0675_bin_23]MYJ23415.1 PQQ-dependent sugar dehydrogenase [Nitrospira sp. SB0673_bin_12]
MISCTRYGSFLAVCLTVFFLLPVHQASALSQTPQPADARIALTPVLTQGLVQPVFIGHAGDHSQRLFILEQPGRIRILRDGTLNASAFLDVSGRVEFGGEMGLLGLAFHPRFSENGRFFINYTRKPDGATVVAEFQVSQNPDRALHNETILLTVPQPYTNHNGGMLAFGPDGYLYIATGDGGAGGDPENRGQTPNTLLGKMLRIDVDRGDSYGIPPDNPFAKQHSGREIFALGFRNPWRFSFDRQTGRLWAADVGQNQWEEINVVEAGNNYGWRIMEGNHCFLPPRGCSTTGLTRPVAEYRNQSPSCAVTGGYVYRGKRVDFLQGTYVFGDYCSGRIMGLIDGQPLVLLASGLRISSFGEDEAGELYVVDHGGGIYTITPRTLSPTREGAGVRG